MRTMFVNFMNNAFGKYFAQYFVKHLVRTVFNGLLNIHTTVTRMPESIQFVNPSQLIMDNSSSIFFFVFLFPLPMIMYTIVYEKTERIREMMKLVIQLLQNDSFYI
jgi:hypothetical protein